jgi:hypothetical protein
MDRRDDAPGGGTADRSAEEGELPGDHGHGGAVDRARARHDGLVGARPFPCRHELRRVLGIDIPMVDRGVPTDEGVAEDELDQVEGAQADHML